MKYQCTTTLLASYLFFHPSAVSAQQITAKKDSASPKKSHWVAGLTYQNNDVYLGRRDSVAVPYLSPSFGYHDKSGFFITATASYLLTPGEHRFDAGSIEGGYSHESDHFSTEITIAKDFFSDQSFAVTSEILGRLSSHFSYDFDFVEPFVDIDANFSEKMDMVLGAGAEHSFSIIDDVLEIDPAVHINFASQNFYDSYYGKRRYNPKRKNGNSATSVTGEVANAAKMQLMDYELESPIEYNWRKKLKLNFTPTLAIPQNPATVTTTTKTPGGKNTSQTTTESLSGIFYFSLGITYSL
jgi:hypothetical protein